jgi:hypothetical protein
LSVVARVIVKRALGALAVVTAAACGFPVTPGGGRDDLASRCAMGFDTFERSRCAPGPKQGALVQHARAELEGIERECKDAASVARVKRLETTCMPEYYAALETLRVERRKVRLRYVTQVSELLVDPEYPPAYDAYKDLEERAQRRDRDDATVDALAASRAKLAALAQKHGIEPSLAKELQLW